MCHSKKAKTQPTSKHGGCKGACADTCSCTDSTAQLCVVSGLFLTAVEPESSNQLRSAAEPWLAPGVRMAHRPGDKPFCSMQKDKTDVHRHCPVPPQTPGCSDTSAGPVWSELRSHKACWFCSMPCPRGCAREPMALKAERERASVSITGFWHSE